MFFNAYKKANGNPLPTYICWFSCPWKILNILAHHRNMAGVIFTTLRFLTPTEITGVIVVFFCKMFIKNNDASSFHLSGIQRQRCSYHIYPVLFSPQSVSVMLVLLSEPLVHFTWQADSAYKMAGFLNLRCLLRWHTKNTEKTSPVLYVKGENLELHSIGSW